MSLAPLISVVSYFSTSCPSPKKFLGGRLILVDSLVLHSQFFQKKKSQQRSYQISTKPANSLNRVLENLITLSKFEKSQQRIHQS